MDYYFNDPKAIKQILSLNRMFSSKRASSDVSNQLFIPFIDDHNSRRDLLKLYQPLSELNLNSHIGFIGDQWRLFESSIGTQTAQGNLVSARDSIAVVLDTIFFRIYEISGELATFLRLNRDKIAGYMEDPHKESSLRYLESLTNLLNCIKSPQLRCDNLYGKQQLALNLSFVYYASHDNTLASLIATAKFFLQSANSESSEGLERPVFPAVKLITRFCTSTCEIHGTTLIPGDRVICLLTPDVSLGELEYYYSDLAFGHGVHKCPGQSFVTINHKCLLEALCKLKFKISILAEHPLSTPYFSGLYDILLTRK